MATAAKIRGASTFLDARLIIPGRDKFTGFMVVDESAKMDKLLGNGGGYDGVDAYPLLGTMMHVGVTNLVQIERTGQHDMMLCKCTGEFACKWTGALVCKNHLHKWAFCCKPCVRVPCKRRKKNRACG
jgi:hypothetical protein